MGRRPNPVILNYFERGEKLSDNSNRYPHRCKACGEDFPKGRMDSLVTHITRKCPAVLESERINACLALHGINGGNSQRVPRANSQVNGTAANPPLTQDQNDWSALQTLAEVSRQFDMSDMNEKQEDHQTHGHTHSHAQTEVTRALVPNPLLAPVGNNPFELHEQFTLENPPLSYDTRPQRDKRDEADVSVAETQQGLTPEEERLQVLLRAEEESGTESNLTMAAAATARLNPSYLDPQLQSLAEHATESVNAVAPALGQASGPAPEPEMIAENTTPERASTPVTGHDSVSPWGEMTGGMSYIPDGIQAPAIVSDQSQQLAFSLNKGGYRMDTSSLNGSRHRHSRARFDSNRRKEVQEVRRIGACIRCRILRKTCSRGTPCDTCRKVLSPRVWLTGCTRTKLAEQIELYSAGVQIVVAQKRVNKLKTDYLLSNNGVTIEASHFHETGHSMVFEVLEGHPSTEAQNGDAPAPAAVGIILIDNDKEDIPAKVEDYMRHILPDLIRLEPSSYVRVTLEYAARVAQETNDELLRRALELWGLVEMMDRERQWTFLKLTGENQPDRWINDESENDAFTNFCMQLTAAAERKAAATSKNLLNGIQRNLQDGKTKLGFPMFLTAMVFLNCVEKTTWAFKAWEGEILRPLWPLEKQPSSYYNQGYGLCDLLRMLLVIRHILPKVSCIDEDSPLVAEEDNETIRKYYEDLNVSPNFLRSRHEQFSFDQSDSRSLEFLFCSTLLRP